jgi:hypothetical protein
MTDHELRQLRDNLMAQFNEMISEELPPCPVELRETFPLPWASQF